MNQPRVYTWSPHPILNPLPLPPHPIPLGCPGAPQALSALLHALNLDWSSVSHMVIYMFQCYSLKPSHTCLFPQSPKVCSLHLCLFCCLAYRVTITIFLNFIYMHFIHLIRTDSNAFFLFFLFFFLFFLILKSLILTCVPKHEQMHSF